MARVKIPRNGNPTTRKATTARGAKDANQVVLTATLEEEIRRRAYELYEQRAGSPGNECDDWLHAEREVLARYNHQGA